jgi:lysophospholipid acyltransferase (LPLAT)-like uncharacterized protein
VPKRVLHWLKRLLLYLFVWAVARTVRRVYLNWNVVESFAGQGHILCLWHNAIFYFLPVLGPLGYAGMISRSRDGADVAWIAERFGLRPVRGSPKEGGGTALREMLRLLAAGRGIAITPDGPKGPRYELKPGVTALARKRGVPVIPLAFSAPSRWEFETWDRMKVPKFFSRTVILAGSPFWAGADDAADQARLQAALRELVRQADRFSGADQTFPDPMLGK